MQGVLRSADAEAHDRRLTRQAPPAELDERVHEEALDAGDAVGREEHPVVGAEQAALVDVVRSSQRASGSKV